MFERRQAETSSLLVKNVADFGKPLPPAPVSPAGGIYQRTPQEQAAYESQLASIPVNTDVPLPVMPMSIGPSNALTKVRLPGDIGEEAYYEAIRNVVNSGDYTPAQLRQMQATRLARPTPSLPGRQRCLWPWDDAHLYDNPNAAWCNDGNDAKH
jgi:hypothetical protein